MGITTYKGTDKDMKCHGGFQYELGKTVKDDGAVRCGDKGFHSCEVPMNIFEYFPMRDGNRFFEAEADGTVDRTGATDSKIASSELTLKAEIGIPGIIKAQMEYVRRACAKATEETASGWSGNAAASGWSGNAAASGESGNAAASGERGNAAASGWSGNAAASGWRGNAAASGVRGAAVSSGYIGSAEVLGDQCVAIGWGEDNKVRGAVGCWLVCTEYENDVIKTAAMARVDGENIKANIWYTLKNGEFVEVQDEED